LWAISIAGRIWKINPAAGSATQFASLGAGFGRSPICIRGLLGAEGSRGRPHLLAASPGEIRSVDLADGQSYSWIKASPGGRLLSDLSVDGYVTVESDGAYIYALEKRASGYYLLRRHLAAKTVDEFPAGNDPAGGPFRVEGRICAYTFDSLLLLGESGLERLPYPMDGPALLSPGEPRNYGIAPGITPWIAFGSDVYLPARGSNYLYLNLDRFPKDCARRPVREWSGISCDTAGQLVMTTPAAVGAAGAIQLFRGPAPAPLLNDPQLRATGAEFVDGHFAAAFVNAVGGPRVRFFREGRSPQDAALTGNIENQIGFYACGAAFALARFDGNRSLGVSVWDMLRDV
jgi:hypothetical protein